MKTRLTLALVFAVILIFAACKNTVDPSHTHDFGDWKVVAQSTFVTEGRETKTCNTCGATGSHQTIPTKPVTNITDWNAALAEIRGGGNGKSYTITIDGDITGMTVMPGTATATAGFGTVTPLTVTLKGSGTLDTTNSQGTMFRLHSGRTLIIDGEDLILRGRKGGQGPHAANAYNTSAIIYIENGGSLELRNGTISGNHVYNIGNVGGGVDVRGTFTMNGGKISDNSNGGANVNLGGGVYVSGGTFTMNGGEISGNSSNNTSTSYRLGTGVYMNSGTFNMNGGKISDNYANGSGSNYGAGVYMNGGTFNMYGGEISGNSVRDGSTNQGGGVYMNGGTFTIYSGTISGNSASDGGGVYVYGGTFRIVTGTVYGSDASPTTLRNRATSGAALYSRYTNYAQYGTYSGTNWVGTNLISSGTVFDTTINVLNGQLQ